MRLAVNAVFVILFYVGPAVCVDLKNAAVTAAAAAANKHLMGMLKKTPCLCTFGTYDSIFLIFRKEAVKKTTGNITQIFLKSSVDAHVVLL